MTKAFAQGIVNPVLPGPLGSGTTESGPAVVGNIIGGVIGAFLIFSFIVAMLYLILGGLDWITSGGDKTKLQSARDKITNALIGMIIVAGAWAITLLLAQFFGIEFPNIPFPTVGG